MSPGITFLFEVALVMGHLRTGCFFANHKCLVNFVYVLFLVSFQNVPVLKPRRAHKGGAMNGEIASYSRF